MMKELNFNNNPINLNTIKANREFIANNDKFKTIFFRFEEGKGLPNHTHDGFATIQVIKGVVNMTFVNGESYRLKDGDILPFDANIEHNVIAEIQSEILVNIIK